jgi:endonuclease/exonuclease/phosphatase family metal-dependent hydrolase
MRLVSYNTQYAKGRDGRFDLTRIADTVRGADVIALQEVERNAARGGMADQPAELGALLPDYYWVYGPPYDVDASETGAEGRVVNRRRQFGNMVLAKRPILSSRLFLLPKTAPLDHFNMQNGVLEAVIEAPDGGGEGALRVFSVHLGHIDKRERQMQVAALLDIMRWSAVAGGVVSGPIPPERLHWTGGRAALPMPREVILMGDFNFEAGTLEYDMMVGPAHAAHGRMPGLDTLVDAWVAAGHAEDEGVTCPDHVGETRSSDLRIDHAFISPTLAGRVRQAWIDSEADGSDHQPVWFEIDL